MKYLIIALLVVGLLASFAERTHAERVWSSGFELATTTNNREFGSFAGATNTVVVSSPLHAGSYALETLKNQTSTTGRNMNHYLITAATGASSTRYYTRIYLYASSTPQAETTTVFYTLDFTNAIPLFGLSLNGTTLSLWDMGTTEWGSIGGTGQITPGTWNMLELGWDLSGGVGSDYIEGRLNGNSFASSTSRTITWGVGRELAGIRGNSSTKNIQADLFFDDWAINDTSTDTLNTSQTSWPGPGYIVHLHPNASGVLAQGSVSGTCSTGWDCVNEVTPNEGVNLYNLDANNDTIDVNLEGTTSSSVNIPQNSATNSTTINVVMVGQREQPATAAADGFVVQLISSGTTALYTHSSTVIVDSAASWHSLESGVLVTKYHVQAEFDPLTLAPWTLSSLDSLRAGVQCTDANPDCYITTLWALVEYTTSTPQLPYGPFIQYPTPTSTRALFKTGGTIIRNSLIFK